MRQSRIARRYAEALMLAAEEQSKAPRIAEDLRQLQRTIRESKEFHLFLKSPVIKREKKREVMRDLFAGSVDGITQQFFDLLAEKGREDVLPEIIEAFFRLEDERQGIVEVGVSAAVDLTAEQEQQLRTQFEGLTGKKIRIAFRRDPALVGGFVARVGDTVFDGSVKRQLQRLREQFVAPVQTN